MGLHRFYKLPILIIVLSILVLFLLLSNTRKNISGSNVNNGISTLDTCIYDSKLHTAFTSLETYNGEHFLAFREAPAHRSKTEFDKGKIKVMKCDKNGTWLISNVFSMQGKDLRDPFLLSYKNHFYLYTLNGYRLEYVNGTWTELSPIHHDVKHRVNLWKIREHDGILYSVAYCIREWPVLLCSKDGINWETVQILRIGGNATEADMAFVRDTMFVCCRIDTPIGSHSVFGSARPPYKNFEWHVMDISLACPELFWYDGVNELLLSGREYSEGSSGRIDSINFKLYSVNQLGKVHVLHTFETGRLGDKGYSSFCMTSGKLFMSYYSGNSDNTVIRLSDITKYLKQ